MGEIYSTTSLKRDKTFEYKRLLQLKYNSTSTSYDALYRNEQRKKYDEIKSLLEKVINAKSTLKHVLLLDAGCGTGLLLEYLYQHVMEVTHTHNMIYYIGLDFSTGMINQAKKKIREESGRIMVDLILADIDFLPLRDNVFDILTAITVVQNLPNLGHSLIELFRVLKRECKLIISYPKKANNKNAISQKISCIDDAKLLSSLSKDLIWYAMK